MRLGKVVVLYIQRLDWFPFALLAELCACSFWLACTRGQVALKVHSVLLLGHRWLQLFNVLLLLSFLLCSRVKVAVMIFLFLKSMFWWTTPTPLDMGCCPLWMLSLDITRSRWPRKTERKRRLSPGGHVLLQGDAVWSKECRGDVPASHDSAVSWYDSQGSLLAYLLRNFRA